MIGARVVGVFVLAAVVARGGAAADTSSSAAPEAPKIRPDDPAAESLNRGDAYAHLISAGLAVSRGRAGEAVREVDAAVALEPASAGLHAQGAALLAMLGRRADADRLARRALELDPSQLEAVRVLADLAAARSFGPKADPQARAEAIRLFERLASEDKDASDDVWSALARLKLAAGDADGAVGDARKLSARRPDDETVLRLLDQALAAAGKSKEALEQTLSWLKTHPDDDDLLPLVVEMARDTGSWALLESLCDTLVQNDPDNVRARALRGEARLRQGHAKEALADLEIARAASPRDPMVRLHIAAAYQSMNRLADATQIAESLASEYPDNTFVRILLAETLARRGEAVPASEEYQAALKSISGEDPEVTARRDEVRLRLASLQLSRGHGDEAAPVLAALEAPEAPDALGVRARAALIRGDAKEAKRLVRLLAAHQPDESALLDGEAELKLGRRERAQERFDAAITKVGPAARGDVAAIYHRSGNDPEAEKQLRAWAQAAPQDASAQLALGAFLERAGKFEAAEPLLRAAISLDGKSAEAFNYLGYSLADRGVRLEEAQTLIQKALDLDPWNGAYLDSLGWAYFKQGRLDDALDPLERAAREFPKDPAVLEHLGDTYDKKGDALKAKGFWQRALDAGPEDDAARESLKRKLGVATSDPSANVVPPKPAS